MLLKGSLLTGSHTSTPPWGCSTKKKVWAGLLLWVYTFQLNGKVTALLLISFPIYTYRDIYFAWYYIMLWIDTRWFIGKVLIIRYESKAVLYVKHNMLIYASQLTVTYCTFYRFTSWTSQTCPSHAACLVLFILQYLILFRGELFYWCLWKSCLSAFQTCSSFDKIVYQARFLHTH